MALFSSRIQFGLAVLLASIPYRLGLLNTPAQAQPITVEVDPVTNNPVTATTVTPNVTNSNQFDITGGTQAGTNLFHSFEQLGLNAAQIANFLANPDIQNILGRVVGGNPSVIDGLIQVTSTGTPNLFLMNPAGIIFGGSARLNVPADFTATTATGIQLGDNWFSAAGSNNYASLLGTPSGFAFTVTEPGSEAGLIVNLGNLNVEQGNLTLLGGIILNAGNLSAQQGQITVTAVPNENLIRINPVGQLLSLEIDPLALAGTRPNNWTLPILALPELLTGDDADNATGIFISNFTNNVELNNPSFSTALTINPTGTVEVAGSSVVSNATTGTLITSGNEFSSVEMVGENLYLQSQADLIINNNHLRSTNNLQLLAEDTVVVEYDLLNPFIIQADGDLTIQGNNSVTLQAPDKWLQSGGNLNLISDGTIAANTNFATSDNFSTLNVLGVPTAFTFTDANSAGIISSLGNVSFASYTGVALKVEAVGSILVGSIDDNGNFIAGDITITEPNTALVGDADLTTPTVVTDPDIPILANSSTLILRAGVTELENPLNISPGFTSTSEPSSPGNIMVGNIDTSAGQDGGPVILSATGNIQTGDINTSEPDSFDSPLLNGSVNISATGNINTGRIVTTIRDLIFNNDGSSVTLASAQGNVVVESIFTGTGGVDVTAFGIFQAVGARENDDPSRRETLKLSENPDLLAFLVSKTGLTEQELLDDIDSVEVFTPNLPISIFALNSGDTRIVIRHSGASAPNSDRISIQGGDAPFIVGPDIFPVAGEEFTPSNPENDFATDFPFSLRRNETYSLTSLPNGVSGTAGAIIIGSIDASITLSFRDQIFGTLPTDGGGDNGNNGGNPIDPGNNVSDGGNPIDPGNNVSDGGNPIDPGNNDTGSVVDDGSDNSDSSSVEVATQFEQQKERSPQQQREIELANQCPRLEERSEPLTDEEKRLAEDCEELELRSRNSQPRLLRIELEVPAEADFQPQQ